MNRRSFLHQGTGAVVLATIPNYLRAQSATASASLYLRSSGAQIPVPESFTGLSYEAAQLGHPDFFSPENKDLVALFRRLGSHGILRIGGNTSEFTVWTPTETDSSSAKDFAAAGPDAGLDIKHTTPVTPRAIRNLAKFLNATGWKLIYGLNLGHGTAEVAAEEAAYVTKTVGSSLLALQIGNEADLYHRNGIRPPDWSYQDFWKQWNEWAQVIRKRIPGVVLAGPDVGNRIDWVEAFAQQSKGEISYLTSHYYAEGPPSNPKMNIELLMKPRLGLIQNIDELLQAARGAGIPYRLSECNSCYHGGKPGVSDTFASALWGADFMLLLAQKGVCGVNFHGGGNGYYTPIAGSPSAGLIARPLYYGMLFFSYFSGSTLLPISLNNGGANMTAYAAKSKQGKLHVALINKDLNKSVKVELSPGTDVAKMHLMRLTAPTPASKEGVTFGGASVSENASWKPQAQTQSRTAKGTFLIDVPAMSAALIVLD